jgi:hypothetical protein
MHLKVTNEKQIPSPLSGKKFFLSYCTNLNKKDKWKYLLKWFIANCNVKIAEENRISGPWIINYFSEKKEYFKNWIKRIKYEGREGESDQLKPLETAKRSHYGSETINSVRNARSQRKFQTSSYPKCNITDYCHNLKKLWVLFPFQFSRYLQYFGVA